MLFNSLVFFAFFAAFYALYLLLQKTPWLKLQNALLLVGSYVFYGWWDWKFLGLIALSTGIDFTVGRSLRKHDDGTEEGDRKRKLLVTASVVANLSILGVFKYLGFFAESATDLLNMFGMAADPFTLNIVLPVGISFYTFQTMSYTIDIYRRKLEPTDSLLDFAVFVAFFPQLVAGPIERASNLLPQVSERRRITSEEVEAGLYLIVYGFFLKVFLADNVAKIVNAVFNKHESFTGLDLGIAVVAFALQIYGDFSGYSKIARGISKLMGFELMVNFRLPYFALNPSDFWQRWHISLSSWLRDYLYIPLGGNRGGAVGTYRNLSLTMLLGGLWHGAAWNFVIWGAFHGAILVIYRLAGVLPDRYEKLKSALKLPPVVVVRWAIMLTFTLIGWLIFRAESAGQIGYFLTEFSFEPSANTVAYVKAIVFYSWLVVLIELLQHFTKDLLILTRLPAPLRGAFYGVMAAITLAWGERESMEFIYFQF